MTGLPQGWIATKLPSVCTKITDGTHHSPVNLPSGDFPYVTAKNIRKWGLDLSNITYVDAATHREIYARCPPEKGDVLYIKDGATTGLAIVNPLDAPFSMLSSVALIKPDHTVIEPEYLKNWLNSPSTLESMLGQMTGTAIRRLTLTTISAQEIPLPPLAEQRRIVRKLDTLSARSTTARTHLTAIEKLVERYKLAVLDEAYFSAMPDTVEHVSFVDALTETQNGLSKRSGGDGAPHKVLRLADLSGNKFEGQDPRSIVLDGNEAAKYLLEKGDLVVVRVNGSEKIVGRLIVWGDEDGWAYCDHFIRARARPDVEPMYLHFFFEADRVRAKIEATFVSSAGQKTVSKKTLAQILVPLPTLGEQREIVRRIETAFAKIDRLAAEAAKALKLLGHLDQRILAKAFAGDLAPQDPNDEPARDLLARIVEARATAPKARRGRKAKT